MTHSRSITIDALLELREFIANNCDGRNCQPSLTLRWLRERNYDVEESEILLGALGACCDCELLWNVPDSVNEIHGTLRVVLKESNEFTAHERSVIERALRESSRPRSSPPRSWIGAVN